MSFSKYTKKCLLVIAIAALFLSIALVQAKTPTSTSVVTSLTSHGTPQTQFNVGDPVYIYWTATPAKTVNVIVYNTDTNTVYAEWLGVAPTAQELIPHIASGDYNVTCTGVGTTNFAAWQFFALPEYVFGALAALAACFVGIAVFGVYKKRSNVPL
jgi:hypothetical protein